MFFLKDGFDSQNFTIIHDNFFELVLPYISGDYAKIYLVAFYFACKKRADISCAELAGILGMDRDKIDEAWDFFESLNIVKKHIKKNTAIYEYSIEFLSLGRLKSGKMPGKNEIEPEILPMEENDNITRMYEQIEDLIGQKLSHYQIRQIDAFLVNYSVAYDVVVEAFKFAYFKKKTKTVKEALSQLKEWVGSGVRTGSDIYEILANTEYRYCLYSKVMRYFGEYRFPSVPEMECMDRWSIEYNFSFEVIKKAIDLSIKIKNPNFNYINGILTNWHESYKARENKIARADVIDTGFEAFYGRIAEEAGLTGLSKSSEKLLKYLYKNYDADIILKTAKGLSKAKLNQKSESVRLLFDELEKNSDIINVGQIGLKELGSITDQKMSSNTRYKKTQPQDKPDKNAPRKISKIYGSSDSHEDLNRKFAAKNKLDNYL